MEIVQSWNKAEIIALIALVIATIGVLVALAAWLIPNPFEPFNSADAAVPSRTYDEPRNNLIDETTPQQNNPPFNSLERNISIKLPYEVPVGSAFGVGWTAPTVNDSYFVLVPASAPDNQGGIAIYAARARNPIIFNAPSNPGKYQIRFKTSDGEVLAREEFTVKEP